MIMSDEEGDPAHEALVQTLRDEQHKVSQGGGTEGPGLGAVGFLDTTRPGLGAVRCRVLYLETTVSSLISVL